MAEGKGQVNRKPAGKPEGKKPGRKEKRAVGPDRAGSRVRLLLRPGVLKKRAAALKCELYALYLAYRDPRVPWYAKAFGAAVLAYALSPIDLIPDFIPVLGYLDDLLLIPLGLALAVRMVPREVMQECRRAARKALDRPVLRSWPAAVIVVALWLGLGAVILWRILWKILGR